ncbi:hypothetical protein COL26_07455 [Bacillus thuringiensis]|uniref:Uncharacterized protein n=1 Tax=Bacillus thuringiensis TaxID=1428 RepID=A0ABD6RXG4_BACTU|nr:hypothetical protein [Bacillus thuringiensis]PER43801.1 hypothetical protein CN495_29945 [Bacillus thuringiensis]PEU96493.1 hypothetical protein CN411_02855 [Bacillus thuringiensis]PFI02880.1 hypothetical protein COI79_30030 [Bacillus thuringiensis]PFW46795.1 hypothetical protein COL26_07455 [Bacillus thuringiensis]PGY80765.1 hypothetical protein COE44_08265 [Bacillus thuringiensis]
MTRHYLIGTLVNWRESVERFYYNESLQCLKEEFQLSDEDTIKAFWLSFYKWYEYRHPKLRELLGEW